MCIYGKYPFSKDSAALYPIPRAQMVLRAVWAVTLQNRRLAGQKGHGRGALCNEKRFNRSVYDIRRAFPKMTEEEARATALESWRNMGGILAEFIKLTQMTPEEFKKHSRIIGAEKMLNAQNVTGGIIHIGHFTNWEAFGLAGAVYGVDKAVLAQRVDNPYVDEETNRLRNIFTGRTFTATTRINLSLPVCDG